MVARMFNSNTHEMEDGESEVYPSLHNKSGSKAKSCLVYISYHDFDSLQVQLALEPD